MSSLAPLLQAFFTERLIGQRDASPHTIASYRDALCLLLRFAQQRLGKAPHQLDIDDIDASLIGAFLNHLETDRGVSVRTRNARLTAIRWLFGFAAYRHPEHAATIQRVLAIPPKRVSRTVVTYLSDIEMQALLDAPDRATGIGCRDHTLLLLALETGLRVSELTSLTCGAIHLGTGAHVRCHGKGRKDRITPLRRHPGTGADLARRAGRRPRRSAVHGTEWKGVEPGCGAPHRGSSRDHRSPGLPITGGQGRFAPHPATQLRHEPAPERGRRRNDRSVARSRRHPNHLRCLHARGPRPEGEGPGSHRPTRHPRRPLPRGRPAPGLPRSPVNMRPPTNARPPPNHTRRGLFAS